MADFCENRDEHSSSIQVVSCQLLTMKAWVQSQGSSCGICCGQNGTDTGFSPSILYFPAIKITSMLHAHVHPSTINTI
jgi:hypothetical protein